MFLRLSAGADLILALPNRSHFSGNRDIISLALRRMLEDEVTLFSMMETEIRSTVTKIYKKQHPSGTASQPKVNLKKFMEACTPLICRDPNVYFKAFTTSVEIGSTGSESSSLASSRGKCMNIFCFNMALYCGSNICSSLNDSCFHIHM